jgi:hypothetical protein
MRTPAGRLLSLAGAIAFIGSGAAILVGNPTAITIIAGVFPVAIAIAIVAVAMASIDAWPVAIASAIGLPMALFLFAFAVFIAVGEAPVAGWLITAAGAAALAAAIRPGAQEPTRALAEQPAH